MWPPSIGVVEIVILAIAVLAAPFFTTKGSRWMLGVIPCLGVAMLITPSDPGSMLLVGGVLIVVYTLGIWVSKLLLGRQDLES